MQWGGKDLEVVSLCALTISLYSSRSPDCINGLCSAAALTLCISNLWSAYIWILTSGSCFLLLNQTHQLNECSVCKLAACLCVSLRNCGLWHAGSTSTIGVSASKWQWEWDRAGDTQICCPTEQCFYVQQYFVFIVASSFCYSSCHPHQGVCPRVCMPCFCVCMCVMINGESLLCKALFLLWTSCQVMCMCVCHRVLSLVCMYSKRQPVQISVEANAHCVQLQLL